MSGCMDMHLLLSSAQVHTHTHALMGSGHIPAVLLPKHSILASLSLDLSLHWKREHRVLSARVKGSEILATSVCKCAAYKSVCE